jgi:hypothetical protein
VIVLVALVSAAGCAAPTNGTPTATGAGAPGSAAVSAPTQAPPLSATAASAPVATAPSAATATAMAAPTTTVSPSTATPLSGPKSTPTPTQAPPTSGPKSTPAPTQAPSTPPPGVTPAPSASVATTRGVAREFAANFAAGQGSGVVAAADGKSWTLAKQADGRFPAQGELLSAVRQPGWAFDNLVLSWAASAPAGSGLAFAVRVQAGAEWSGWYTLGTWRGGVGSSVRGQSDAWGKVDVDTLQLARPAQAYQYRVSFESTAGAVAPTLRSVSVALADMSRPPAGPPVTLAAGWQRELAVPVESQVIQDPAVAWSICSPTSLTMALRFLGASVTVPQVYKGVKDQVSGIYGNWPLNMAYAAQLGFDAYVARLYSLDQVRAEIAAGRPVPISVKYASGELQGAALASTSGHLILVRGFTADGKVIINDPASPDLASVRHVVPADQLERVWLRSGGIAYMLGPQQ